MKEERKKNRMKEKRKKKKLKRSIYFPSSCALPDRGLLWEDNNALYGKVKLQLLETISSCVQIILIRPQSNTASLLAKIHSCCLNQTKKCKQGWIYSDLTGSDLTGTARPATLLDPSGSPASFLPQP